MESVVHSGIVQECSPWHSRAVDSPDFGVRQRRQRGEWGHPKLRIGMGSTCNKTRGDRVCEKEGGRERERERERAEDKRPFIFGYSH